MSLAAHTATPELSVVVPFFNEADSIGPLFVELRAAVESLGIAPEVIAVNDGSSDATAGILEVAAREWAAVRVIHFPKNRGQAAALFDGFHAARGEWIAMLDGDGQNPPGAAGFRRHDFRCAREPAGFQVAQNDVPRRQRCAPCAAA
jgi:glycosyltransferase involved in cell wall biosynthesis